MECLRIRWHISTSFYIINAIIMCQKRMVSHRRVCQPFPISMGNVGLSSVHVTTTFSSSCLFCSLVNCLWFTLTFKSSLSTAPSPPHTHWGSQLQVLCPLMTTQASWSQSCPWMETWAPARISRGAEAVSVLANRPPFHSAPSGYCRALFAEPFPVPPSLPAIGMLLRIGSLSCQV